MVLFGIVVILLSIFVPYVLRIRESGRRTQCSENLRQIWTALSTYAKDNGYLYPRVVYDEANNPNGYTAFTGIDDPNPFAANSAVQPNDVTASLWLLVRLGLVDTRAFVCPSSDDSRDLLTDAGGRFVKPQQRGNFRRASHLSYSYSSPFSTAPGYRMDYDRKGWFALMADKNPGVAPPAYDVTSPAWDAPALELVKANSRNHGGAGQNVLFGGGDVQFARTPYCGVGRDKHPAGDNIFTALAPAPLVDAKRPLYEQGYWAHDIGPAWEADSYLVPTAEEAPGVPMVRPTRPATRPATQPATATTATAPPATQVSPVPPPTTATVPATAATATTTTTPSQ